MSNNTNRARPTALSIPPLTDLPPLMTVADVASAAGVVDRTVRGWVASGLLKAGKTARGGSGRIVIRRDDLLRMLGLEVRP